MQAEYNFEEVKSEIVARLETDQAFVEAFWGSARKALQRFGLNPADLEKVVGQIVMQWQDQGVWINPSETIACGWCVHMQDIEACQPGPPPS